MINERMFGLGNEPSAIRELAAYGAQRKAQIGEENVFDYSLGNPSVPAPEAVRTAANVYMTVGAAASIALSISAVTQPGDEVIVISPYFPEYKVWIGTAGCTCVEVPAHVPDFQLDIDALDAAIGPKTSVVIINTPNNPTGAVYSRANLEALAALLERKEAELDRPIYLISDEPYREIAYDGVEVPYVPTL